MLALTKKETLANKANKANKANWTSELGFVSITQVFTAGLKRRGKPVRQHALGT